METKTIRMTFYECEHGGDLEYYTDDLVLSGAKIISSHVDHDAEIGHVMAEVDDYDLFLEKFKVTDSYGFSQFGVL